MLFVILLVEVNVEPGELVELISLLLILVVEIGAEIAVHCKVCGYAVVARTLLTIFCWAVAGIIIVWDGIVEPG